MKGKRIRVNGRLYEAVRGSGKMNESLDWNIFSKREKDEIRDLLSRSIYDIRYDRSEEALDSVKSFLESVDMRLEDYSVELDFGIEDTRLDVELGESWYDVEDLGGLDGGVSNGYYVGEGMLTVWERNLPKLRRLADKWVDAFDAHDPDDWDDDPNDDPKFNRAEDAFLKAAESVRDALVEVATDDITGDVADAGSDYWFERELEDGSEWVVNAIDDYLLDKEDSEYADNE